ncbi:hypothetical protein BU14_0328s0039 [Porphyra umbilicalis]|uniref:ATP synthase F1 complex delta/epsilon subunit N-terminal domain-containing protein n=1 Tax=Porphyra umbilicalis TaxID=2786 RepID=A0A1X6NYZ5_PORUM|nr:hypothetical protein BU14_0328s0038 [Porphyra umbilicalis]OSX73788.1 hypothetical protein BU14_0328s0039 [Porphyra umbilicalis]|eukprot:OSX73787.1 hypothetical protein BU14_0328s0038 [Porphyra umbilicalis]
MFRQAASRASALARQSAAGGQRRQMAEAVAADKLHFNFFLPGGTIQKDAAVDMVLVPASSGVMGILPRHAPTVAQLRPGVVEVHSEGTKDKYFVSSGFAFVHKDRTDVCAVAAAPLSDLDASAVAQGVTDAEAAMAAAKTDMEKAEAQIGLDTYTAMRSALTMA